VKSLSKFQTQSWFILYLRNTMGIFLIGMINITATIFSLKENIKQVA